MAVFVIKRALGLLPMMLLASLLTFGLMQLQPGDPVQYAVPFELQKYPAEIEKVRIQLGMHRHWTVQYVRWLDRLAHGDMGYSFQTGEKVAAKLARVIPNTLILNVPAFLISVVLAVAMGAVSATRRNSAIDQGITLFGVAGVAVPSFFTGILLMLLFVLKLRWLPSSGMYTPGREKELLDLARHAVMPVTVYVVESLAGLSRYVRSSMLEVLKQDYVRTARAKGLGDPAVIYKHALRNALMPVVTIMGLSLPGFISGSIVVENLFGWPGMGRAFTTALFQKDYPTMLGCIVIFSGLTILGNLLADVMYAAVDPRVKYS